MLISRFDCRVHPADHASLCVWSVESYAHADEDADMLKSIIVVASGGNTSHNATVGGRPRPVLLHTDMVHLLLRYRFGGNCTFERDKFVLGHDRGKWRGKKAT